MAITPTISNAGQHTLLNAHLNQKLSQETTKVIKHNRAIESCTADFYNISLLENELVQINPFS